MSMIALVDCNNFFVSCERTFRPDLHHTPVAVLSNNDGCIISRSDEVKALGIPMGEPVFKCKKRLEANNVVTFSTNFSLYLDISNRIMNLLSEFSPDVDIYSIDECFLKISTLPVGINTYDEFGFYIREYILKCTGIPVSIGFAPTKTLAKLANHMAKVSKRYVCDITLYNQDHILKTVRVNTIWGIGRRLTPTLEKHGIKTAFQYKYAPESLIKKIGNLPAMQTQLELRGIPCIQLETNTKANKSILSSRSFGSPIDDIDLLKGAVAANMTIAASKLRRQDLVAGALSVFIKTNKHQNHYQKNSTSMILPQATSSTQELVGYAIAALEKIYLKGTTYVKSGVMLVNLSNEDGLQYTLFTQDDEKEKQEQQQKLMKAMDSINDKWGRNTLTSARLKDKDRPWESKQEQKSPNYSTKWSDIPEVKL